MEVMTLTADKERLRVTLTAKLADAEEAVEAAQAEKASLEQQLLEATAKLERIQEENDMLKKPPSARPITPIRVRRLSKKTLSPLGGALEENRDYHGHQMTTT